MQREEVISQFVRGFRDVGDYHHLMMVKRGFWETGRIDESSCRPYAYRKDVV